MNPRIDGFDWDDGNSQKCRKHGISTAEIENLFSRPVMMLPDTAHSGTEKRFWAIGKSDHRHIFVVFTFRMKGGKRLIRPISARYMHKKEIDRYEEENPAVQN